MPQQHATYAVPRADLGQALLEFAPDQPYIALDVLPALPVDKEAATMLRVTRENLKNEATTLANGAAYNRVNLITEDVAFACIDYGLETQITDKDRAKFAQDMDAELEYTRNLHNKLLRAREIRTAAAVFNTTTWTGSDVLYHDWSAAPWDAAASDAIGHVLAGKTILAKNCGFTANALILGEETLVNLLGNTAIKARFPGAPIITEDMLRANIAAIFGLQKLIVGKAYYNSADEGIAWSGTSIWGDDYAMVARVADGGNVASPGIGRTPIWTAMANADGSPKITQYREEQTRSDVFREELYEECKVLDAYFGFLLKVDA